MERARDLAMQAAAIAAGLTNDEIVSFRWQGTLDTGVYQVTLELKEGVRKQYTVIERQEGSEDTP